MYKIALITDKENPALVPSDQLLIPEFYKNDIRAIPIVWENDQVDLLQFDAIIIRNTWDYFLKVEKFNAWIKNLKTLKIPVFNNVDNIIENMHKFYLKKMAKSGIDIIPTVFKKANEYISEKTILSLNSEKIIIKPAISAGSFKTEILSLNEAFIVSETHKSGDWLIQQFMNEIQSFGEVSLIYFNRRFKYAIRKKAKIGDFRVQYQFGGTYTEFEPTIDQLKAASKVLNTIKGDLLFARVDGIMVENKFLLMEIELIEPDLYFGLFEAAPSLFVKATLELLTKNLNKTYSEFET